MLIEFRQGATWRRLLKWRRGEAIVPFPEHTRVEVEFRRSPTAPVEYKAVPETGEVIVNTSMGQAVLEIEPAQTSLLAPGNYLVFVWVYYPNGRVQASDGFHVVVSQGIVRS